MAGAGIHPYHQPWPLAAAPPAPGVVPPPPPVPGVPDAAAAARPGTADEVRTILITGLPTDVKERELHNLLRWLPGFEASEINFMGEQPMGFALFSSVQHADAAKAALKDSVFDAETKAVLHTEMARKNLFVKRGLGTDASAVDQSKRLRTCGPYTHSPYAPPYHPPPPAVSMWGTAGYIAAPPPYNPYAAYPVPPLAMASPSSVPGPTAYAPMQDTGMYLKTSRLEAGQQQESNACIRETDMSFSGGGDINVEYVSSKTEQHTGDASVPTTSFNSYFDDQTDDIEEGPSHIQEEHMVDAYDARDSDLKESNEEELAAIEAESESIATTELLSQESDSNHVPLLGMQFETYADAYKFYNAYASIVGFTVTKYSTYQCRNKKKPMYGQTTRRTYKCNMHTSKTVGVQTLKRGGNGGTPPIPSTAPSNKKTNKLQVTKCPAEMVVTLLKGMWTVTTINLEHNHPLVVKQQEVVENERIARDMTQVMQWFSKMQATEHMFYYTFDLVEGSTKVKNIFWSSAQNRKYYEEFGDFISFDTTYNTNIHNMKFAPIVGVTSHGENCLFGCAFLQDETIETFVWLFRQFLECMGGKHPKTIITDQDLAMRAAIKEVFPNTDHRNCYFHIARKAEERGGRTFAMDKNKKLHADLFDILRKSLTVAEFENLYALLPQRYDVSGFKYLGDMWRMRKSFAPVYFKDKFYPFVHSAARSEGTNALFKLDVGPSYSVMRFMHEYKRIAKETEKNQRTQDYTTKISSPTLRSGYEFEKQAAKLLNRTIFYKFQNEINLTTKLMCEEIVKDKRYAVYKAPEHRENDFRTRKYIVTLSLPEEIYICICCKFQKDGILCSHVLKVLQKLNIFKLHEKYFIDRWRARDQKLDSTKTVVPVIEIESDSQLRYNVLCRRLCGLASDGAKSAEKFKLVLEDAEKTEGKLKQMPDDVEKTDSRVNPVEETSNTKLPKPDFVSKKGIPANSKRTIGIPEKMRKKQVIHCSHSDGGDHNIKTCKKLASPGSTT